MVILVENLSLGDSDIKIVSCQRKFLVRQISLKKKKTYSKKQHFVNSGYELLGH